MSAWLQEAVTNLSEPHAIGTTPIATITEPGNIANISTLSSGSNTTAATTSLIVFSKDLRFSNAVA
jgi:hypothetical protein